jgi:PAS domain S-box-containing protein
MLKKRKNSLPHYTRILTACILAFCLGTPFLLSAQQDQRSSPSLNLTPEERAFLSGKTLRLGVDAARPPFEYIDEKGNYSGISAGFMGECTRRLGVKTVLVPGLNVGAAMKKMKEGEIDVIPKISPEPERAREILFTKPHATFASVIVTRKDVRPISGADDLAGLKVGVIKGLIVETRVKQDYPNLQLVSLPDVRTALVELSSGRIDVYIENMPIVSYNMDKLKLTNLKIAAQTPYIYDMAFGIRKDWPLLATALDKALASLSKEEINAITSRWAVMEYKPGIDWKLFGPFAGAILLIFIFVLIWNRRLRKSISDRNRIQDELKKHARALENSASIKSKLAMMSNELQKAENFEGLSQTLMYHLAPLTGISYGALYIMNEKEGRLQLAGGYGLMDPEEQSRRVAIGEGLVGQCALELTAINVTDLHNSPVKIAWGGGHLHPQEILLLPVLQADGVLGVLELATLEPFTSEQRTLLDDLMPLVALNIDILRRNIRTRELLEQSRSQSAALAASESQLLARQHELEQSREILAQAEEKSRMLLDAISVGTIIIDPETRNIVDVNPVAIRMIGLTKEEIVGRICHRFICPRERNNCPVLDLELKIDNAERVLITGEGREIPVLKSVTPVLMDGRKYLVESFVDITEQKKMECELRKSGEQLRVLSNALEQSPASVVITNREGVIEYVNPKFSSLTGYSAAEAIGNRPRILKSGLQTEDYYKDLWKTILGGNEWHGEICNKKKNGELYWEQASISAIRQEDGQISHFVSVREDITERKKMDGELKQQMEEMERFNRLTITRELKMIELKREINDLLRQTGGREKYRIVSEADSNDADQT